MKNENPFVLLPNKMIADKNISGAAEKLYGGLLYFCHGNKTTCYPMTATLQKITGIKSPTTITKAKKELIAGKWITVDRRYVTSDLYKVKRVKKDYTMVPRKCFGLSDNTFKLYTYLLLSCFDDITTIKTAKIKNDIGLSTKNTKTLKRYIKELIDRKLMFEDIEDRQNRKEDKKAITSIQINKINEVKSVSQTRYFMFDYPVKSVSLTLYFLFHYPVKSVYETDYINNTIYNKTLVKGQNLPLFFSHNKQNRTEYTTDITEILPKEPVVPIPAGKPAVPISPDIENKKDTETETNLPNNPGAKKSFAPPAPVDDDFDFLEANGNMPEKFDRKATRKNVKLPNLDNEQYQEYKTSIENLTDEQQAEYYGYVNHELKLWEKPITDQNKLVRRFIKEFHFNHPIAVHYQKLSEWQREMEISSKELFA